MKRIGWLLNHRWGGGGTSCTPYKDFIQSFKLNRFIQSFDKIVFRAKNRRQDVPPTLVVDLLACERSFYGNLVRFTSKDTLFSICKMVQLFIPYSTWIVLPQKLQQVLLNRITLGQDIFDYNIRMITLSEVCFQLNEANFRKEDLLNGPKLIL